METKDKIKLLMCKKIDIKLSMHINYKYNFITIIV